MNIFSLRFRLIAYRRFLMLVPLSIGSAVAIFSPTDVFQYSWVRVIVNIMATTVPMIDRLNAQFELTQVAQLYFSIMWLLAPIIYYLFDFGDRDKQLSEIQAHKSPFWLRFALVLALFPFAVWIIFFVGLNPFASGGQEYFILHSRLGMAIYGGIIVFGFAAWVKLLISWIGCFLEIYFQGREK